MRPDTFNYLQKLIQALSNLAKQSDREVPDLTETEKERLRDLRDRLDVAARDAVPVTTPFDPAAAKAAKMSSQFVGKYSGQQFMGMPKFALPGQLPGQEGPIAPPVPIEKWTSAGGVVFPSMEDFEHVYIIKPANNYGPWSFPKGQVDEGETKEKAAIREVWEETGIRAKILPGESYIGKGTGSHSITHYFLMVQTGGSPRPTEETERVLLLSWEEAARKFKSANNSRDYKILRKAQALIQQRKG